jgi:hypothetical protein
MARASRCIVPSAKVYVARVIPVKRMAGATLALFDVADCNKIVHSITHKVLLWLIQMLKTESSA